MVASLDPSASDLTSRRSLEFISHAVAKSKRIVVVTGAGISCSCGIPDFRSSDGLYNLVKKQYPNVVLKGRDLFDASLFRDPESTSVFYTFISQLKQSIDTATPSPTHHFIKTLDTKKKLLRSYTQNIDGLEERAGLVGSSGENARVDGKGKAKLRVKDVRNVQLHGDIHRVRCTFCSADLPCTEEYLRLFDDGLAPDCPECSLRSEVRMARSARPLKIGTLRPAIVLYDEAHPLGDDIGSIQASDIARKPDMLIVMGTSLKVHGLRRLVKEFAKSVHASAPTVESTSAKATFTRQWAHKVIFVNKTPPGSEWNGIIDYHVAGETDAWAEKVLEDWRKARPADWQVQQTLDGNADHATEKFRHVKDVSGGSGTKGHIATAYKKPFVVGVENVPPKDDVSVSPPIKMPTSPKRRKSTSHYADGKCSPSKKRELVNWEGLAPNERGLLFNNATNNPAAKDSDSDHDKDVPLCQTFAQKRRTKTSNVRGRAKNMKDGMKEVVEVVLFSSNVRPGAPSRLGSRVRSSCDVSRVDVDAFS